METIDYRGWPNCRRLSNGIVELILTTDIGPRLIRFGFTGEANEFKEYDDMVGKVGGDEWRLYGGHRLWHAPEDDPRTYFPDNEPVAIEAHGDMVRLIQAPEPTTRLQKEIDVRLAPDAARVEVTHRLRNTHVWGVEFAPWALSVMAPGGTAIIPLPPRGTHPEQLLPTNTLTLWAFTDMSDPRWTWGRKYILLRQDAAATTPQKIGVQVPDGWAAYAHDGHLFVKKFRYQPGAAYPDLGSAVETFTNDEMLELETVAPLVRLEPGATVEHVETWFLFRDVPTPRNDAEVDRNVLPHVIAALAGG